MSLADRKSNMSVIYDTLATNEAIAVSRDGMVPQRRAKGYGKGGVLVPNASQSAMDVLLDARMGVQSTTALVESAGGKAGQDPGRDQVGYRAPVQCIPHLG